jgi:hypothetical protein
MRTKIFLLRRNTAAHRTILPPDSLRTIPKHLSQVAGTQCIDRHWRSLKEFIGKTFPRKLKGTFGSKLHPEIDTLIKQWLYRISAPGASPIEVYQNLTHVLPSL